eukprot:TRINITY_DN64765_c0_g1_i1.p1 TRINITY_DN64765_c0_g1~~TRINITY_DN64765_c0_g1_i1.p1  ORF type:complete len:463 (+),score=102.37 TRINITY_DN64765_c0_g1_i1:45-1391(+)
MDAKEDEAKEPTGQLANGLAQTAEDKDMQDDAPTVDKEADAPTEDLLQDDAPTEDLHQEDAPTEDDAEEKGELQQLIADVKYHIEDFVVLNRLFLPSHKQLDRLPARVALRTMGLLGEENSFYMQEKQTNSALSNRARMAAEAETKKLPAKPLANWSKILGLFMELNKLSKDTEETLSTLTREQVIRVMGFTTRLRFMLGPADRGEGDFEVFCRIKASLSGISLCPVMQRTGNPLKGRTSPTEALREQQSVVAATTMSLAARRQLPAHLRQDNRSRSPRGHLHGGSRTGSAHVSLPHDLAPFWQSNLREFIKLNKLDTKSENVLLALPKEQALEVMGLLGTEHTFVIRNVRNCSANVMLRVAKAKERQRPDTMLNPQLPPFAQIEHLRDEFIQVNNLEGYARDMMQKATRDVLLKVLGFTADNSFVLQGVANPSATVRARIVQAQRQL